jgi:hypothetical protein
VTRLVEAASEEAREDGTHVDLQVSAARLVGDG